MYFIGLDAKEERVWFTRNHLGNGGGGVGFDGADALACLDHVKFYGFT